MGLTSLFPPILATTGLVAGVYIPISMSLFGTNSTTSDSTNSSLTTHEKATNIQTTNHQENYNKLSEEGPFLSCNEHGRNYKVYLALSQAEEGGQEWKKEIANSRLTFKVVDAQNNNKVVWGPDAIESEKWTNWEIYFGAGSEVKLRVPPVSSKDYSSTSYYVITCQEAKIDKTVDVTGGEVTVAAEKNHGHNPNILKVQVDSGKCISKDISDGKQEECDLKFSTGVNLKWRDGFSPKVIFQTIGTKQ